MPAHVHLINPLTSANGGSEWHTLALFEELAKITDVTIWTEYKPDPLLVGKYPIKVIDPAHGQFPKSGNLVFIGVYFGISAWLKAVKPRRTIVFFNTPDYHRLPMTVDALISTGIGNVEVAYQAESFRQHFPQYPGPVHPSFIDLELFQPREKPTGSPFVVGRMSRDDPEKHHPDSPKLYREVADLGCEVRIQGGTSQRQAINDPRIELLPSGQFPPQVFLQSLDCFLYQIRPDFYEAWGRVLTEAMACGVPVVAHENGGYTQFIDHGENGFLFATHEEAIQQVMALKNHPSLRKEIGRKARQKVEAIYSEEAMAKVAEFYAR